jgi:Plavaka transposase
LDTIDQEATVFTRACKEAEIKPIQQPFWKNLPFVDIFCSLTLNILHQLYQGVVKHLIGWVYCTCGDVKIDACCRRLPPNHYIHLFLKGILHLSCVTGTEHDQICCFLLGIIIDIRLPYGYSNAQLLRAVQGLLNFVYLTRYLVHTADTLNQLDEALCAFNKNQQIFIDLGICLDFNFPKGHFTGHYCKLIECYGTADNFNTKYMEQLHINLAKDAYHSTNTKNEYLQMTAWLDQHEQVICHDKDVKLLPLILQIS